jgi:C2 domain
MGESVPSLNLAVAVHQARIDLPLNSLIICHQVTVKYNDIIVRSNLSYHTAPIWDQIFNFEYTEGCLSVYLLNNPPFCKQNILGTCKIPAKKITGWFELKNDQKKIGAVRVTVQLDKNEKYLQKQYQTKIQLLQSTQKEVSCLKNKYIKKIARLKQEKYKLLQIKENIEDTEHFHDLNTRAYTLRNEQKDLLKKKALIRIQEEKIEIEKDKIRRAWEEIGTEKKELENIIDDIKGKYLEFHVDKQRTNLKKRISGYLKPRVLTPKSSKTISTRLYQYSMSQPRLTTNDSEDSH